MKVGDTIWEHYGFEQWRPLAIIGETSRSWLIPPAWRPFKVPKKGLHPGYAFSEQECDDWTWANQHNWKIADAVRCCHDAAKLRQIAEIIGWKPEA